MTASLKSSDPCPARCELAARIATAPISWGVCEVPGWGLQLPVRRVLSEMASLGFTHTELGSAGWMPTTATALLETLAEHELSLLGAFVPLVLHDPARAETARQQARETVRLLAEVGARHFITAPVTSDDWQPREALTDVQWRHLYAMVDEIQDLCADHGLEHVIHEHVGCVIETKDEVDALLAETSAKLVLDTGHLALGGYDPLEFACTKSDRVGLVHLKDTRYPIAHQLCAGRLSLMEAVQAGLFPALGQGDLPLVEIVNSLEAQGYRGWYVIEQDCAITDGEPPAGEGPVVDVAASVAFLNTNVASPSRAGATPGAEPASVGLEIPEVRHRIVAQLQ